MGQLYSEIYMFQLIEMYIRPPSVSAKLSKHVRFNYLLHSFADMYSSLAKCGLCS